MSIVVHLDAPAAHSAKASRAGLSAITRAVCDSKRVIVQTGAGISTNAGIAVSQHPSELGRHVHTFGPDLRLLLLLCG